MVDCVGVRVRCEGGGHRLEALSFPKSKVLGGQVRASQTRVCNVMQRDELPRVWNQNDRSFVYLEVRPQEGGARVASEGEPNF